MPPPQIRQFQTECTNTKYPLQLGQFLKMTDILKKSVQEVFRRFYTEWLLFSGYEYAGFTDIEVYPVVENGAIHGHSEVWIAIKNKED